MHATWGPRGFTMIELVVIMLLMGILAVAAIPMVMDKSAFAARGGRDFLASTLRYAQKSAVVMRRNVCVAIAGTGVTVTYATASGVDQACAGANELVNPANGLAFSDATNALPGGASVAAPVSVTFDGQGRALSAPSTVLTSALTVTVTGYATAITIEPDTGNVH